MCVCMWTLRGVRKCSFVCACACGPSLVSASVRSCARVHVDPPGFPQVFVRVCVRMCVHGVRRCPCLHACTTRGMHMTHILYPDSAPLDLNPLWLSLVVCPFPNRDLQQTIKYDTSQCHTSHYCLQRSPQRHRAWDPEMRCPRHQRRLVTFPPFPFCAPHTPGT